MSIVASYTLIAAALFHGLSCTTNMTEEEKHAFMTKWFDGVPPLGDPAATNQAAAAYVPRRGEFAGRGRPTPVAWNVHPPFEERECGECHASRFNNLVKEPF